MRKTPRFTPSILKRFEAEGRGTGTYQYYVPWHQVRRADPSSKGRSHLQKWDRRQHDLLSDQELIAFLFSTMHPQVCDIREQMPLMLESARHELSAYCVDTVSSPFPGTKEIAEQLSMKHPILRHGGESAHWVLTTDLLLTLKDSTGAMSLLAISVKPAKPIPEKKRSNALLNLEREYWAKRGVPWLLITADLYDRLVGQRIRATSCWAFGDRVDHSLLQWMIVQKQNFHRKNLTHILNRSVAQCGDLAMAQDTFWRGIWSGQLNFDLHRSRRPSAPFILVSQEQFWERNPIVSGRSSWF